MRGLLSMGRTPSADLRLVLRGIAGVLLVLCATACTTPRVRTQVTSFSQPTLLDQQPRTFRFDLRPGQADSLEHETYTHLVADQLLILGYKQDPDGRLAVSFDESLQAQEVMVQTGYGGYDPYFGAGYGFYGPGRYMGQGPWGAYGPWGWGGWGPYYPGVAYPQTVARARFRVDIRVAATGAKAFEGTVTYGGTIDDMTVLMPYLVQAMFTDFPGLNGQMRRVVIPLQKE